MLHMHCSAAFWLQSFRPACQLAWTGQVFCLTCSKLATSKQLAQAAEHCLPPARDGPKQKGPRCKWGSTQFCAPCERWCPEQWKQAEQAKAPRQPAYKVHTAGGDHSSKPCPAEQQCNPWYIITALRQTPQIPAASAPGTSQQISSPGASSKAASSSSACAAALATRCARLASSSISISGSRASERSTCSMSQAAWSPKSVGSGIC